MRIKRLFTLSLFSSVFFLVTSSVYADMTNIVNNITSNNNSTGNINSVNTVQTNTNSNGSTSTSIKINDNGKETDYESNQPGSVTVNSSNGNVHVQVNNNRDQNLSGTSSPSATPRLEKLEDKLKKHILPTAKPDQKTSSLSASLKIFNFDVRQFFYNLFNLKWF